MTDPLDDIRSIAKRVEPVDPAWFERAWRRLDSLTKPPRSLGRLELVAAQLAAIQQTLAPASRPAAVVVFAGDHGVAAHGVSAYPQEVTAQMVANFAAGGAAINQLAKAAGAELVVYDVGVAHDLPEMPRVRHAKVRRGTADMTAGPAMTPQEARDAVLTGFHAAEALILERGVRVLAIGEMGIANTTAASALFCGLTGIDPVSSVGAGTGLDEEGISRKAEVVRKALHTNQASLADPASALASVGGLEIAAMAGAFLACATHKAAAVLDGFISSVSALAACRICPACAGYFVSSHRSRERGHSLVLDELRIEPLLDLDLRLGEASGAALALPLIDAACAVMNGMATFAEAGVSGPTEQ
ncbi:MAG: nicotinate-nucleotide--dimethylbenzimidazole phosphoribosyltransferase [Coriobacteriia bacterium]|nr:nicotinate-nucleotide--dimethylbenzimidazole phosphoribosyltransferase [Coriobacteriia bacterium]